MFFKGRVGSMHICVAAYVSASIAFEKPLKEPEWRVSSNGQACALQPAADQSRISERGRISRCVGARKEEARRAEAEARARGAAPLPTVP